jgi:hypothetical protein
MMNMTLFHRVTRIPQTAASGIAGTLGKRSGGVGGGSAPPTARSSDRYPARSGACTPLSPHPVQGVTPLAHHFGGPGCQNPLFPRPETMNDPFAIAYPSTLRASPPNSFARAPCEARAPISVITGREQAGRSPGKSATKPMKMQGARQILCIKESSASIRTLHGSSRAGSISTASSSRARIDRRDPALYREDVAQGRPAPEAFFIPGQFVGAQAIDAGMGGWLSGASVSASRSPPTRPTCSTPTEIRCNRARPQFSGRRS